MDNELTKRMQKALKQLQFLLKVKKGVDVETERLRILEELMKEQTQYENTHSSASQTR